MQKEDNIDSPLVQLKKNNALWGIIAFLALAIAPIEFNVPDPYLKIFITIGTSLFVALTVSYLINKRISSITNFEVKELINNKFPKLLQIEKIGLEKIVYGNEMDSVGLDLAEASELYIAMNDGKNFFTNNSRKLSERFRMENRKTVVILMSPDSDSEKILNKRHDKDEEGYYAQKIRNVKKDYISSHKDAPKTNILEIRYFIFNVSMSVVATEDLALVGLYRNTAGKSLTPPSFLFKNSGNSCEYLNIFKDVKTLADASQIVWPSEQVL